jgi:hypothetical protein
MKWAPELMSTVLEKRKVFLLPGFEPRTVQPAGSCYTDCTNRATTLSVALYLNFYLNLEALSCLGFVKENLLLYDIDYPI